MDWCKAATTRSAITRPEVADATKGRCLEDIEAYMEAHYIKEAEQQKTTYQGQLDMFVLECQIAAAEILELDEHPIEALRVMLAEKAKELKVLPPSKAGAPGQQMYKEAKKESNKERKKKMKVDKAGPSGTGKRLGKLAQAMEALNPKDASYLENFLTRDGAKGIIDYISTLEVDKATSALALEEASDFEKDLEIKRLKTRIQMMVDTATNVIEKAHDKGVTFTPAWYDRLGYDGDRPGFQLHTAASQVSRQSTLSTHEVEHDVYEGVVVPMIKARWPRKFLPSGSQYGNVPKPDGLLSPMANGRKRRIDADCA